MTDTSILRSVCVVCASAVVFSACTQNTSSPLTTTSSPTPTSPQASSPSTVTSSGAGTGTGNDNGTGKTQTTTTASPTPSTPDYVTDPLIPFDEWDAVVKDLPDCSGTLFTSVPVDLDNVLSIIPLGNFNPPGHTQPTDHIYFALKGTGDRAYDTANGIKVPVYAPSDITVTLVDNSDSAGDGDYAIYYAPCRQVRAHFGHLSEVSDALKNATPIKTETDNSGHTRRFMNFKIKAGDAVGKTGGKKDVAVDFATIDARIPALDFIYPAALDLSSNLAAHGINALHASCPLDLYDNTLKSTLQALLGGWDGTTRRTVEPLCGQILFDIPDTAQGVWFDNAIVADPPKGSGNDMLTLAFDNVNPSTGVIVHGSIVGGQKNVYTFTPTTSGNLNRTFKDVTASGGVFCYGTANDAFSYLVLMADSNTLKIERRDATSCGNGPWTLSQTAVTFLRK